MYVGEGAGGLLGCLDASEMPDTYGVPFDAVRGFVCGGWPHVANREGDLSGRSPLLRLSLADLDADLLPRLSAHDRGLTRVGLSERGLEDCDAIAIARELMSSTVREQAERADAEEVAKPAAAKRIRLVGKQAAPASLPKASILATRQVFRKRIMTKRRA